MSDMTSLHAFGSDQMKDAGLLIFKVLAVVGGAGLGAVATSWLVRGLSRLLLHQPASAGFLWLRWLGAAAGGLAVYVWVFGPGGGGWGGGGAGGGGSGSGGSDVAVATQPEGKKDTTPGVTGTHDLPQVVIIRSQDYQPGSKRYYLVDGQPPPQRLDDVVKILKERKQKDPSLETIKVVTYQDSAAEAFGLVRDLKDAVKPLGIAVQPEKPPMKSP